MSSEYQTILEAANTAVTALVLPESWNVVLRKEPSFVPLQDRFPQIVIAPRKGLQPRVVRVLFSRVAILDYDVYAGAFVDSRWAIEQTYRLTDVSEALRRAMWSLQALSATAIEHDVNLDPEWGEAQTPPANVDGHWMRFSYRVKTTRAAAG